MLGTPAELLPETNVRLAVVLEVAAEIAGQQRQWGTVLNTQ